MYFSSKKIARAVSLQTLFVQEGGWNLWKKISAQHRQRLRSFEKLWVVDFLELLTLFLFQILASFLSLLDFEKVGLDWCLLGAALTIKLQP